ncbi:putative clathrin assembly protein [Cucumis melo var. makuwa]|uniref:Clathrin assembly protein n=1 Tax=Cucumis melo var. makuwa TaxID=1194695 RepID=A0A5D3D9T1_CUCMM|nr:putative clathrin assembly protein [Cucumis melo var. makuwa]TYK20325.1 putative clathrin assembly protein [Cucumis melo var. makuwa]
MSDEGTQNSLRKALGALKDTTIVSLDIAIVKSTNHVECTAKEKYLRGVFLDALLKIVMFLQN